MEAWFSVETARYFSFLSCFALLACLRVYAKQGRCRMGVMITCWCVFGLGITFLLGAGMALILNQPGYVIFALGLTGIVMVTALSFSILELSREYRESELRRSIAQDL